MKSLIILIAILALSTSLHISDMVKSLSIDINDPFEDNDVIVTFTRIHDCTEDHMGFHCELDYEVEGAKEEEHLRLVIG
jgi:hypothetical protein